MISPYAVKLRTETLDKVGTRAGDLYAVSTIGSVAAALITGFLLIPYFGVVKLTVSIGVLLLVLAASVYISKKNNWIKSAGISVLIIFIASSYYPHGDEKFKGVVELQNSAYGEIRILDVDDERYLLIDGGIHSGINRVTKENIMKYAWVIDLGKNITGISGDMLLIGLGGGSVLKSFYDDGWDVEAVEIDPAVTGMAVKYFGVDPSHGTIHHMDGREFLKNTDRKYDLIILDAFGSSAIPFHLTTIEVFTLMKKRLHQDGVILVNVETLGWDDIIVKAISATLKKVFTNVTALPIAEPPDKLGNVIITASDGLIELKNELSRDYLIPDYRFSASYERVHAWDNRFIPDTKGIPVLTDDLNPVEVWSEKINVQARKELHSYLGSRSFLW